MLKGQMEVEGDGKCKGAHELPWCRVLLVPEDYQLMPGFDICTNSVEESCDPTQLKQQCTAVC